MVPGDSVEKEADHVWSLSLLIDDDGESGENEKIGFVVIDESGEAVGENPNRDSRDESTVGNGTTVFFFTRVGRDGAIGGRNDGRLGDKNRVGGSMVDFCPCNGGRMVIVGDVVGWAALAVGLNLTCASDFRRPGGVGGVTTMIGFCVIVFVAGVVFSVTAPNGCGWSTCGDVVRSDWCTEACNEEFSKVFTDCRRTEVAL